MPKKIETGTAKRVPKKSITQPEVTLVTFSMKATIPVQAYGNLQPEITVTAKTIEDARAVVLPFIEELYQQYAEATPDGRTPKFFKRQDVSVTEKIVAPVPPVSSDNTGATAAYLKGMGMVQNALSIDALNEIERLINASVKLTNDEKTSLLKDVADKKQQFETAPKN